MNMLVELLILVIAAVVVFLVARYICDQAEFDPPLRKIVLLIIGIVFLLWLVNVIAGHPFVGPVVGVRW